MQNFVYCSPDWFRPKKYLHFDSRVGEKDRANLLTQLKDSSWVGRHAFLPFIRYDKKKYKVKKAGDKKRYREDSVRHVCYASHTDSQIYRYYACLLSEKYEKILFELGIAQEVIAFRRLKDRISGKPKCNIHLAHDGFNAIRGVGNCHVYAFDVKGFFDNLQAYHLKKSWARVLGATSLPRDHYNIFKSVTKFAYVERDAVFGEFGINPESKHVRELKNICSPLEFRTRVRANGHIKVANVGIPQGSPISAVLANVYMLSFDEAVTRKMRESGGSYFRYCDDILCIVPSENKFDVEGYINEELSRLGLNINSQKTDISHFSKRENILTSDKPIQYLGFVFDGKSASIRPGSLSKYRRKAKAAIMFAVVSRIKANRLRQKRGLPAEPLYLKSVFRGYLSTQGRNFISYGRRAAEIMSSKTITRQINRLESFLAKEIKVAKETSSLNVQSTKLLTVIK